MTTLRKERLLKIVEAVAAHYEIPMETLKHSHSRDAVEARRVVVLLANDLAGAFNSDIRSVLDCAWPSSLLKSAKNDQYARNESERVRVEL